MKRMGITVALLAVGAICFASWTRAQNEQAPVDQPAAQNPALPAGVGQPGQPAKSLNPDDVELDIPVVSYGIGMRMGNDVKQQMDNPDNKEQFIADDIYKGAAAMLNGEVSESYAIGVTIGMQLKHQFSGEQAPMIADPKQLLAGFEAGLLNKEPTITKDKLDQAMAQFHQKILLLQIQAAQQQRQQVEKLADANAAQARAFLAQNKAKEGVKTTPSGLQYIVEKEGDGASPKDGDAVTVNYAGMFINGQEFDSSYKRGQPATFRVDQVIPGWTEALKMMKVGGKWKLFIPPDLAYGPEGSGQAIPPNALLIFDVELLKVDGQ